jgi:hypothetical protein
LLVNGRLAGVFPPGFPLLLAAGFLAGAPMVIGPGLAAGLVVASWWLARELAIAEGVAAERVEAIGRTGAGFSVASAALRYHTADPLPHGAVALAIAVAFAAALFGRRWASRSPVRCVRAFVGAGAAVGSLVALEPASAIAIGGVVLALARIPPQSSGEAHPWPLSRRAVLWGFVAALPGVILLGIGQRAATGSVFTAPERLYASLTDPVGPLQGVLPWLLRIARCARAHALAVVNFEPLLLLAGAGLVRPRGSAPRWAAAIIGLQLAIGVFVAQTTGEATARLIGVVPVEHALLALAIGRVFPAAIGRGATAALGLSLVGFATHAERVHQAFANGDIGRPRFDPDVERFSGPPTGVMFFDDDAGYELAFDPLLVASHALVAARAVGDDHDRLLYDLLGHPPTRRYAAAREGRPTLSPWVPPGEGGDTWRFEAETDWPPVALEGGATHRNQIGGGCRSAGQAVVVTPVLAPEGAKAESKNAGGAARATFPVPVPRGVPALERRTWIVTPQVVMGGSSGEGVLELTTTLGGPALAHWSWNDSPAQRPRGSPCVELAAQAVDLPSDMGRAWLVVSARAGPVEIDRTTFRAR